MLGGKQNKIDVETVGVDGTAEGKRVIENTPKAWSDSASGSTSTCIPPIPDTHGEFETELMNSIADALKVYAEKKAKQQQKKHEGGASETESEAVAENKASSRSITQWWSEQLLGWRKESWPDKQYHGLWRRAVKSPLFALMQGDNVELDDIDTAIGTLAMVDALVVTIPFGLWLESSAFDDIRNQIDACPANSFAAEQNYTFEEAYSNYRTSQVYVSYSSVGCMCAALMYYMMKPRKHVSQEELTRWWKHGGRYVFFFMLIFTIIAIVCLLILAVFFLKYVSVPTFNFCDGVSYYHYTAGYSIVLFLLTVSFFLML